MFSMHVDVQKNRLYITIGVLDSHEDVLDFFSEVEKILDQLKPGFFCVTDLREYRRVSDSSEELILEVQKILKKAGIARAVRIERPRSLPEHVQFETGSLEAGYSTEFVRSMEEAEEMLSYFEGERDS